MLSKEFISKAFNKYFNGQKNFVTPKVYGFTSKRFGDKILLIEKSKGEYYGENYQDIKMVYAVTTLLMTGDKLQRIDLCKSFDKPTKANYYINKINNEMVENADLYGEVKTISL